MIPGGGKDLRLALSSAGQRNSGTFWRGARAARLSRRIFNRENPQIGNLARLSSCRPITTCQREAKAIPLISRTDRAEISATDRADCGGTRFSGPPFWRILQPVLRSVAYPSEGHPFANEFSARLVVFHVRGSLADLG